MFANRKHEEAFNCIRDQEYEKALKILEEVRKEFPKDANVFGDMAVAHLHLKNKSEAFGAFDKAIELQPEYSYRYSSRAYGKDYFGDLDGGIEDYQKAVELDPEDAVAYNNLGLLLEKKGYHDLAKEKFERADKLRKIEDSLQQVMEDIEKGEDNDENQDKNINILNDIESDGKTKLDNKNNDSQLTNKTKDPLEKRAKTASAFGEFRKIFTSKKQFGDFLKFIKDGFKIKKHLRK